MKLPTLTIGACLLIGCGPPSETSGTDSGASSTGTSTTSTTEDTTTESTGETEASSSGSESGSDTEVQTGTDTGTDTDTDTGTDTGTDTDSDVCDAGEAFQFYFEFSEAPGIGIDADYNWTCEVLLQDHSEESFSLSLMCSDGDESTEATLDVSVGTGLTGLSFPEQIKLRYLQDSPWWTEEWVRLESMSGELLFAAGYGSSITPFEVEPSEFYAPFSINVSESECTTFEDSCGERARFVVGLSDGEGSWDLIAPSATLTDGGHQIWLRDASKFIDQPNCTDTPNQWYAMGIMREP